MKPWRQIVAVLAFVVVASCTSQPSTQAHRDAAVPAPVKQIPDPGPNRTTGAEPAFQSYDEAMQYVRATYPGESIETGRSSCITGAEYFNADGRGYLILAMRGRDYIFAGVPVDVWNGFKQAPSLGSYYNSEIRGRYHFDLGGD
jgi:hypothetical protein